MTAPATSSRARTESRPGRRVRDERGTSAIEFSIIAPVFLLLIFAIIQTGLYFQARNAAQSSAREGVSYLRLAGTNSDPDSFEANAEQVAESYASKLGRLKNVDAIANIDERNGRVSIVVIGTTVLPLGGTVEVQQTSSATLEQFRGDLR